MEKSQEILYHIDELYTQKPSEEAVLRHCEENPTRYQAWVDAFKDYDLSDVLEAIDSFWEYKNSKSKPNVAQIKAILNAHKTEKSSSSSDTPEMNYFAPAESLMTRDIELKCNRHLLAVYKLAVDYITQDLLLEVIPSSEWRKMDFSQKLLLAKKKGLFDRFDEVLVYVCKLNYGKEYQFESESILENANKRTGKTFEDGVNLLANHWRM